MSKDWFTEEQFKAAMSAYLHSKHDLDKMHTNNLLAALRAVNPFEWRGIDSAPKKSVITGRYDVERGPDILVSGMKSDGSRYRCDACFFPTFNKGRGKWSIELMDGYSAPDKWMPLPPAPEGE